MRWLYHQAMRVPPTVDAMRVALHRYRSRFPTSIRESVSLLAECGVDPYSLLFAGFLRCSLESPVSLDTQINLSTESDDGWFRVAPEHGF